MRPGFRAIPFAAVAVTLRAFLRIDLPGGIQVGFGRSQGILQAFVFRGHDPGFVFLGYPVNDQDANEKKESGKENPTEPKRARRMSGHGNRKNFRTTAVPNKSVTKQLGGAEDEPEKFGVEEKDRGGDDPGEDGSGARVGELTHF